METEVTEKTEFVAKTLKDLFGLEGAPGKAQWVVPAVPSPLAPKVNPHYMFRDDLLRKVLIWASGSVNRNLLLSGPTGSGKTSLPEQFCARTGWAYYKVSCHGRMEFSELVGQLTILEDGSTQFVHGPLVRAMLEGAVLLLDEFNFVPPAISGALNTVLDGSALLIPATGELIQPHPRFRVAATGNSVDRGDDAASYAGTQRMNLAMIQRFLTMKVDYMTPLDEAKVLHRIAPKLPGKLITGLIALANEVRTAFVKGDIDTTIATRTLENMAKLLTTRLDALKNDCKGELAFALQFVLTDGLHASTAQTIEGLMQRTMGAITLTPADWPDGKEAPAVAVPTVSKPRATTAKQTLRFLVNPDRSGSGPSFWATVTEASADVSTAVKVFSGDFRSPIRTHASISLAESERRAEEKATKRGYSVASIINTDQAEVVLPNVVKALEVWHANGGATSTSGTIIVPDEEAKSMATEIVSDLGGGVVFV